MNIIFYFDPSCPWCWITSRWLDEVSKQRDITIDWRPFSLAIKNDELGGDDPTGHRDMHIFAHQILRVIEAIVADGIANRFDLYTAFSKAGFVDGATPSDAYITDILKQLDIDVSYASAAEDTSYDAVLEQHVQSAIDIVGDDVGVPLIIFETDNGKKQGFFGPVLQQLPATEEGLKLWDGLSALATSEHIYELKRTRTKSADTSTTARLFS